MAAEYQPNHQNKPFKKNEHLLQRLEGLCVRKNTALQNQVSHKKDGMSAPL
jgi:hypothetical protein